MRMPCINLLALPCAGASAIMYLRWRNLLPEWIRVVPVELPGRGVRMDEPFAENFEHLVAQICEEQAALMRGPYALFGHSMGALLAYGIAQRQRASGRPLPSSLFVSACAAPSRRDPERFAGHDDETRLIADLRKHGGTPEDVFGSAELLQLALETLAADYRVCDSFRYIAQPLLPVPLHVLAGRGDDLTTGCIGAWRQETGGAFSLDWFDGGHFFIRPCERGVLAVIVRELVYRFPGARHAASCVA
ncbi:thioesterase II family protein [Noviherbaspirillum aerium]|uniref:thioesterase II family protein n=1 Tax=Noviherbaspirillum aerium TaxID=2588497 RepID=UPI00124DCFFB|nr:alpha/beta fold hydrolase [Noviherbaspirillum aerium]